MWHAGSDVMGCRRPTGGVFSYVSSDRVTLRAFPVATQCLVPHSGNHGYIRNLRLSPPLGLKLKLKKYIFYNPTAQNTLDLPKMTLYGDKNVL